jgi:thymidylate kinase
MGDGKATGLVVAVIGPDGSGKSTLVRGLAAAWDRAGGDPPLVYRRSLGTLPRHRALKSWFTIRRRTPAPAPPAEHPALLRVRSAPRSILYPTYLALDLVLSARRIRAFRASGRLVLFDRFFHDCFFQTANQRTPAAYLRALERLVPRPDLLLSIERDPEEIYAMKPDLPVEEIRRQAAVVRQIVTSREFGAILDGRADSDMCVRSAISVIADRFPDTVLGRTGTARRSDERSPLDDTRPL